MAVLGASDGEIVWRRVMPKHEGGVKYLFSSRTGPITVSTNGVVRFWDNTNGRQGALVRETYPNEKSYKLGQCIRLSSRFQILFIILVNDPKTALPVQSKPITATAPTKPLLKSIDCRLS